VRAQKEGSKLVRLSFRSRINQILSTLLKPVQRKGAGRYLQLNLLSFAGSVSLIRIFLEITGYPQLGNETLHIAHVLYGGILLYISSLLPLIYANRRAYTWSSVLSGLGVGLFIDEVGKFITQNNDYFFPAAAPIIYAFFLTSVLVYTRVAKEPPLDTRSEFYAVLESLKDVIDHDMDPEEQSELRRRLKRIKKKALNTDLGLLSDQILEFVDSEAIYIAPDEPTLFDKATIWLDGFERRWLSRGRVRLFITMGVLLMGLGASIRLGYFLITVGNPVLFEALLRGRVGLSVVTDAILFWAVIQWVMEGLVGLILLISAALLIFGREKAGLGLSSIGLVVSLVGVNLIQFYIDQFSTAVKTFIQFLILYIMYYYQRRFRIR
jgi:hypothetical protein